MAALIFCIAMEETGAMSVLCVCVCVCILRISFLAANAKCFPTLRRVHNIMDRSVHHYTHVCPSVCTYCFGLSRYSDVGASVPFVMLYRLLTTMSTNHPFQTHRRWHPTTQAHHPMVVRAHPIKQCCPPPLFAGEGNNLAQSHSSRNS